MKSFARRNLFLALVPTSITFVIACGLAGPPRGLGDEVPNTFQNPGSPAVGNGPAGTGGFGGATTSSTGGAGGVIQECPTGTTDTTCAASPCETAISVVSGISPQCSACYSEVTAVSGPCGTQFTNCSADTPCATINQCILASAPVNLDAIDACGVGPCGTPQSVEWENEWACIEGYCGKDCAQTTHVFCDDGCIAGSASSSASSTGTAGP